MYACDNCGARAPHASGRCPTCNMRLRPDSVTAVAEDNEATAPTDLDVSHRCGNCGEPAISEGGKCRACRFPIPASQLPNVPGAAVVPLPPRRGAPGHRHAS